MRTASFHVCRLRFHRDIVTRIELRDPDSSAENGASAAAEHAEPDILADPEIHNDMALAALSFEDLISGIEMVAVVRRIWVCRQLARAFSPSSLAIAECQ